MAPTHQDISDTATQPASGALLAPAPRGLRVAGAVGLLIWAAPHIAFFTDIPPGYWLPGFAVCLSVLVVLARLMPGHYPHDSFGACNFVTMLRGALTLALVTPLIAGAPPGWPVFCVALIAASLDGVDGWLARQSGLASAFGARFDMETDSLLALVLTLHALADGLAWPVALVLGGARYLFLGAMTVAPWLGQPLPERFSRKAICAVQLSVLVALQAPPLASGAGGALAMMAAAAVLFSFSRDILWLWERRT